MLYNLFPSDLPCGEIFRGNIALRKSDKSANCHAATELQGKKTAYGNNHHQIRQGSASFLR